MDLRQPSCMLLYYYYCNAVYAGALKTVTDKLQRVLNAASAARMVSYTRKFDRGLMSLPHDELHWLDVPERVTYKMGVMMYRCLHGQAPCYLADHFTTSSNVASRLRLRSAHRHQLIVPRCRLNTYGRWAFSIAGLTLWNSLPDELRDPACGSDSFKQFLKTILFSLTRVGNLGFIFEFQTSFLIRSWLSPVYNFTTSAIFATSDHFLASVQLTLSVHHLYTQD